MLSGKPLFGTLIALLEEGRPILGVIDQPLSLENIDWNNNVWMAGTSFLRQKKHGMKLQKHEI